MREIKQIPLKFKPQPYLRRQDFLATACNREALNMVESWPDWPYFALVLYGPQGCGKSHLAHVFAEKVAAQCQYPIAVPIIHAKEVTPARVERFHRDNPCLVIEKLTAQINCEAMFHLFNLYQNQGGFILFTAETAPARMRFSLPDLQSRLNMLPAVPISEPDDDLLAALIVKLFTDRSLIISLEVLHFIIQNMHRSFSYAQKLVAEIDEISLAYKRAISIPLVKEAMRNISKTEQLDLF